MFDLSHLRTVTAYFDPRDLQTEQAYIYRSMQSITTMRASEVRGFYSTAVPAGGRGHANNCYCYKLSGASSASLFTERADAKEMPQPAHAHTEHSLPFSSSLKTRQEEDASAQQGKEKQRPGPDTTKATHAHSAQYNAHPPAGSHSQPPSNSQCGHSMAPEEAASKNTAEEAELEYRKILNLFSDIQKIVKTKNKVIVIGGLKVVDEKQDPNEYAPFEKTETEKDIEAKKEGSFKIAEGKAQTKGNRRQNGQGRR
mmetsp:Transcript_545/g.1216  ORF Transcript_545/g.1216 Transcript_545/m.1216 type:complete len:255 (+) Transcript_545:79-843(+)